ncbi:hypothetical protein SBDP1_420018 [Syntrophobacter sp. SbD1]|nr:hypothetical protein SBDP1_420018 [Syntrophobacter sp. SbD1]
MRDRVTIGLEVAIFAAPFEREPILSSNFITVNVTVHGQWEVFHFR